MRPIRIDHKLDNYFGKLVDKELLQANSAISKAKAEILKLRNSYNSLDKEYQVLEEITADFKKFILLRPEEQEQFVKEWDSDLFYDRPNASTRKKTNSFSKKILEALDYEEFRKSYAHKIIETIGLKTCPYCNAMLTVVTNSKNGNKKSRFQLDHFFPKSKYPLLSISFFNLIPSCGNCNITKSSRNVTLGLDFHLYANDTPLEGFTFQITKCSEAKYRLSNNRDDIEVGFKHGQDGNTKYATNHDKTYGISELYNTQIDIVEELFWKSKAYSASRIKELSLILKIDEALVHRMVIGSYIDKEDIHKRPLTKFTQDIARQLKLIK
ncbi:MAG TPA: hypothetical protein VMW01_17655 [Williamwhitmania sp.]|nr:hypothetical protein [Williamwhitmania sp.]